MYIESNSGGTNKVIVDNTQSCAECSARAQLLRMYLAGFEK